MQQSNPILFIISNILDEIIKETDSLELESNSLFHAVSAPAITIFNYLQRISKYTHCSEQCFVIALIYLDRLQEKHAYLSQKISFLRNQLNFSLLACLKSYDCQNCKFLSQFIDVSTYNKMPRAQNFYQNQNF